MPPNAWYYNRNQICANNLGLQYQLKNIDGVVIGTGNLDIDQDIELPSSSTAWTETDDVTLATATGPVTELDVALYSGCESACTTPGTDAFNGKDQITVGQTLSGSLDFSDKVAYGSVDTFTTGYDIHVTQPGTVPTEPDSKWSSPPSDRCDDELSSDINEATGSAVGQRVKPDDLDPPDEGTGCVDSQYTPFILLPMSTYHGSAAMIAWAQNTLPDHWGAYGQGQPLHRYSGKARQKANRAAICGNGWQNPLFPGDSCDEFSFAASYESGALLGLTGAQCAEIQPVENANGTWSINYIRPVSGTERCVTGHVLLTDNAAVGRALGTFIVQERVLDNDPYWVIVAQ